MSDTFFTLSGEHLTQDGSVGKLTRLLTTPLRNTRRAANLHRQIRQSSQLRVTIGAGNEMDGWITTEPSLVDLLEPESWQRLASA